MSNANEHTAEFALIETIAGTIRGELGDAVEACPGFRSPEHAEPLNRVFGALARHLLEPVVAPDDDLSRFVSWVLSRLVARRLAAGGLGERPIRVLFDLEPGTPDDWLIFLVLVPWCEILFWLASAADEPE
jgi:hypothetical protein